MAKQYLAWVGVNIAERKRGGRFSVIFNAGRVQAL